MNAWEACFDYVVASHVIEHVADVVGFLQDIERILLPEGVIALAIPDKRFTMDRFRRETSLADLIANHSIRANRPTPFQVIDHFSGVRKVDLAAAWDSELLIEDCPRLHTDQESLIHLKSSIEKGVWHDVHASVFTPTSLISLISDLNRLDFIRLSVRYMAPTPRLQLEFFLQLS